MNKELLDIIREAIDEINAGADEPVVYSEDLILTGAEGVLDSLSLVTLLSTVEELVSDKYEKNITLASDKAFSKKHSPFHSVETLTLFLEELLEGADKR